MTGSRGVTISISAFPRLVLLWGAGMLPLVFWPGFEDAFKLPQWALVCIAAGGIGCVLVCAGRAFFRVPGYGPVAVLLAWVVVSSVAGAHSRASETIWWIAVAVMGLGGATLLVARYRSELLAMFVMAGAASSAYAILQFLGLDFVPAAGPGAVARPFSTMGNPDFLAAFLVVVLPLAVVSWSVRPGVFWGAAIAAISGGLLISQSRGAWIGVAASAAAAPVLLRLSGRRVRLSRSLAAGAVLAALGVGTFFLFHGQARDRLLNMANVRHFDAAGRLMMWRSSMAMVRSTAVLGSGPGSFGRIYPPYHARLLSRDPALPYFHTENAHNDYLQFAAELGIVGFGLLIWVWVVFARSALLRVRAGSDWALGVLLGFVGMQANAVFNFPWYLLPTAGWFWMSFGFVAPQAGSQRGVESQGMPVGAARARTFAGAAVVALAIGLAVARDLQAGAWLKFSGDMLASGNWSASLMCAERSLGVWGLWEGKRRAAGNASRAAYHSGHFARAMAHGRLALSLMPNGPADLSHIGLVLARQGRYAEAEEACLRALALNPNQAEAYHHLGNVAYLKGNEAAAADYWRRALAKNPALAGARESLASLERSKKRSRSGR